MVQDMDLNYCAGKLRIATFGRGVYETDLLLSSPTSTYPVIGDVLPTPTDIITSNTTWSSSHVIKAGIKVTNNATLTISGSGTTIEMPYNGLIYVDPGSKLIVDGAKLTNSCGGMWKGIIAKGNKFLPQTGGNQATVEIQNSAIIEHARFAVSNWDSRIGVATTGGIIKAENSAFKNNKKSIEFQAYQNILSGNPIGDKSYFTRCSFTVISGSTSTNGNYKGDAVGYPFDCHVSMWEVKGINFTGCSFKNEISGSASEKTGFGILSYNAGYNVIPYCSTGNMSPCSGTLTHSVFEGFTAGINAEGDLNYLGAVNVDYADFDKNSIGVRVKNVNNVAVLHSAFTIGHGKPYHLSDCFQNAGTYTLNSKQFRIEQNDYTGVTPTSPPSGFQNLGAVTENSGSYSYDLSETNDNDIYANTFHDLDRGGVAIGYNSSPLIQPGGHQKGLRYKCNTFENTVYDIEVVTTGSTDGIAGDQANFSVSSGYMDAGNSFSSGVTYNIVNGGHPFAYYYYSSAPIVSNVALNAALNSFECNSRMPAGNIRLSSVERGTLADKKAEDGDYLQILRADYVSLINGGSSDEEVTNAMSTMSAPDIYDMLSNASPYVSEVVLRYVIENSLLGSSQIETILMDNPEVLRNEDFINFLEGAGFDPNMMRDASQTNTDRSVLEAGLLYYEQDIDYANNMLISDIKTDSLFTNAAQLPGLYRGMNTLSSYYDLVGYYYSVGKLDSAQMVYDDIESHFTLSTEETQAYEDFGEVWNIMKGLKEDTLGYDALSNNQLDMLNAIATTYEGKNLGNIASGPVDFFHGFPGHPCPEGKRTPVSAITTPKPSKVKRPEEIRAFPNPADKQVFFSYNLPDAKGQLQLTITDIRGKQVESFNLKDKRGLQVWYTKELPNGIYLYEVRDSRQKLGNGKVVIVK